MLALDDGWLARGGHVAAGICSGWIGLAGPYDFLPIKNPEVRPVFFWPDSPPQSQPINHVRRGAPPALLMASRKDDVVNPTRNTGGLALQAARGRACQRRICISPAPSHATLVATLSRPLRRLAPVLDQVVGLSLKARTPTQ
jgi:hypothetical protein